MFDFTLSSEQSMMVDTTKNLVKKHVIDSRVDMKLDRSGEFPKDVYKTFWEAGVVNLELPEKFGGAGLKCVDACLVQEEIGYGCLGILTAVNANMLAAMPIMLSGNEKAGKKYLSQLVETPSFAAYGCSEPDAGSDVAALTTRFVKKGDKYIINGQKRWISNGDVADWYTVFAREDGTKGHKGIACFVIEAKAKGSRWDGMVHKLGQRASHTCDLIFEEVEVSADDMLAGPDHGFKLAMATFDRSRPWIGAGASGIIRRARDESLRYANDRKTFGTPIINHQMIQQMIADMEISYQATRLLTLNAAAAVDRNELRGTLSACAKAYGADAAMEATTNAVQVFGGYGYTNEFVVEKLMRDAKLLQIYEGTSQIQRMVITRDLQRQMAG